MQKPIKNRLLTAKQILICDIDNTLLGDKQALQRLLEQIKAAGDDIAFGIATGRRVESTLKVLKEWNVPIPDVLITSVGSEIHYGPHIIHDANWTKHIDYRWEPDKIKEGMNSFSEGIRLQPPVDQRDYKISYYIDSKKAPSLKKIKSTLRRLNLRVNVIYSHHEFLDILPIRASKDLAVRYFALKWKLPFDKILVAGDSGNDADMLRGNTLAVIVGNYSSELEKLRGESNIYFADGHYAEGIIEGLDHFAFLENNRNSCC